MFPGGSGDDVGRTLTVGLVGAGAMGSGIAQVALLAGHRVVVYDAVAGAAARCVAAVLDRLDRLVDKGRLPADDRAAAAGRITVASELADLAPARLVIEAVIE